MNRAEIMARFDELKAASQAAYEAQVGDKRTPETMLAAKAASRALSDFMVQHPFLMPKVSKSKFSNQAGRRQYNERPENIRLGRRA